MGQMPEYRCGECFHFDRKDAQGVFISPDGRKGFCRVNKGLLLGERVESSRCPPHQQHIL